MFLKRQDEVNVKLQRLNAASYVYSHVPPGMNWDEENTCLLQMMFNWKSSRLC